MTIKGQAILRFFGLLLFVAAVHAQDVIGSIDFFGYKGIDLQPVIAAVPVHAGDPFRNTEREAVRTRIKEAIRNVMRDEPAGVTFVCCNPKKEWMIFIGLRENGSQPVRYTSRPDGAAVFPAEVIELYSERERLLPDAIRAQAAEDTSNGYSLNAYPPMREKQLAMREFALGNERLVREVLKSSREDKQRAVAAEVLGYADTTRTQVSALVKASFDANNEVRNNAVRALSVIALSNPKRAQLIDAGPFIPLLNSATWSDRNKSAALLEVLSKSRQPELMAKLRADALDSLIEMAKWNNPGHAYFSRAILGRIAGIEEVRLKTILDGDWSQILKLL
jgi:hypothetical protein